MFIWFFFAVVLLFVALIVGSLLQVEDWERDLSENRAETSVESNDESLHPLEIAGSIEETCEQIQTAVAKLPGWKIESQSVTDSKASIELTRTTRLFRFTDDVSLSIESIGEGCRINAVSQSRVGKGDLGQNPRNIRELFAAIQMK